MLFDRNTIPIYQIMAVTFQFDFSFRSESNILDYSSLVMSAPAGTSYQASWDHSKQGPC